ncbi:MFS transporter [Rossellomorea marisflavi]|uniref:MFS transporter n=1 Tax=Rossellomorea marisflavi TaxID=189381 RepID=UPI00064E8BF8|nr:MFS transporter [Rossellomorea marisflavi]KMK91892.1 macrolide transporter [Rossellomorea marisflavi]
MWKNKNVWILLSGEFIAGLGLWLGIIGNLEFMQEKVPSDFMKSLILASGLLAGLAVGPYAGKLIDRTKKKTVMLAAGFIRVVSVVFMLIAIQTGSVMWMVVFLMVIQLSAAFYFPALQAAIPMVVKGKELLQMNGVHMNVSTLSRILGTALGGVLLVIMPLYMLYILSLLAYAILFGLTWFLSFQEEEVSTMAKGKAGGFKEVFPVLKNLPIVSMTLIMTLIPLLFIGGFNLMVINISEIQDSTAIKGWIYTAEGLSFMIGAFAVKRIGEKISPYRILFTFSFIIGIAQLVLYFAGNPVLSVLSFIIFGFAVGCFFPTAATIFQTRIPKDYHGRFFSFRNMLDRMAFQVVLLMTGLLLDLVGLPVMTVLFGGFSLIMTTIFYVRFKALQEGKTQEIEA